MTNNEFLELCAMTPEQLKESELGREIASLSEELGIPHPELLGMLAQAKLLDGFDGSLMQSQKPSPETEPGSQPKTKASRSGGKGPTTSGCADDAAGLGMRDAAIKKNSGKTGDGSDR